MLPTALLLGVAFLVLYPVGPLLVATLTGAPPGVVAPLTLQYWVDTYTDPFVYQLVSNSVILASVESVAGVAIAVALLWTVQRTNMPGRGLLGVLLMVPFFIPPVLTTLGWAMLANPKAGLLNVALRDALGWSPVNIYSWGGLVWVSTLNSVAFLYMLLWGPFQAMDRSLEEASAMSGADRMTTVVKITLPLMAPALLGGLILAFIRGLEAFETATFLGTPARISVFMNGIFNYLTNFSPPRYGHATALSVSLLLLCLVLTLLYWRYLGSRQFTVVTGRGYRPQEYDIGVWRWVAFAFVVGYLVVAVALPLSQIVAGSFLRVFGIYRWEQVTLENYRVVLANPSTWSALGNSLLLAGGGAAVATALCGFVSYTTHRTSFAGRRVLDFLTWVPWTVPGLVLGIGMLWAYIALPPRWPCTGRSGSF